MYEIVLIIILLAFKVVGSITLVNRMYGTSGRSGRSPKMFVFHLVPWMFSQMTLEIKFLSKML